MTKPSSPEEGTRQRRPHRKSRNGCKACKARRTKCDEQGPPCVNCTIRRTECVYENRTPRGLTLGDSPTSNIGSSPAVSTSSNRNHLELELLFHWITYTADTMGSCEEDCANWRIMTTKEALTFDPLQDALFAVSAAHMAESMNTSQLRDRYVTASVEYYGRCCEKFQNEVLNITPHNAKAVLFCSITLIVLRLYIAHYGTEEETYVNRVMAVFEMLQGTWSIANIVHDENEEASLNPEILLRTYEPIALDADTAQALVRLRMINQENRLKRVPTARWTNQEPCDQAIGLLEQWWARAHVKSQGTAMIWLLMVPREFVFLIKSGDCIAQLVLMHWAVMFEDLCGDRHWWGRSIGLRLVQELISGLNSVGSSHPAVIETLVWARRRVKW